MSGSSDKDNNNKGEAKKVLRHTYDAENLWKVTALCLISALVSWAGSWHMYGGGLSREEVRHIVNRATDDAITLSKAKEVAENYGPYLKDKRYLQNVLQQNTNRLSRIEDEISQLKDIVSKIQARLSKRSNLVPDDRRPIPLRPKSDNGARGGARGDVEPS